MFRITMNNKMVITNLRINKNDWLQLKTMAAELGMSANEYINFLIEDFSKKRTFPSKIKSSSSFWDLSRFSKIIDKPMGMSKDDKIIYG